MQAQLPTKSSSHARHVARACAGLLLIFVGADHYYEYSVDGYSVLPTVGTLFLLNFISASLLGMLLLAPVKRVFHRLGTRILELTTVGGFGIAVTSLAALLISERTRLFGWMELNYRPAIVVALVSEAAATLSLGLLLLLLRRGRRGRSISSELIEYAQARPRAT
jgi:hypothetical protein